jgi:hypothetical protein
MAADSANALDLNQADRRLNPQPARELKRRPFICGEMISSVGGAYD